MNLLQNDVSKNVRCNLLGESQMYFTSAFWLLIWSNLFCVCAYLSVCVCVCVCIFFFVNLKIYYYQAHLTVNSLFFALLRFSLRVQLSPSYFSVSKSKHVCLLVWTYISFCACMYVMKDVKLQKESRLTNFIIKEI